MKRVVVTGLGCITPLGSTYKTTWKNLIQSKCGIERINFKDIPSEVAGLCHKDYKVNYSQEKNLALFMKYGMVAADEALQDARWTDTTLVQKQRTGVCIGSGFSSVNDVFEAGTFLYSQQARKVSPYFVPKILTNQTAGHVAIKYGFQAVNHSVSTACATGAHSIGDAMRFIQMGDADVIVCGGTEAAVSPLGMIGFCRAKSLSTEFNSQPQKASRPFDRDRDGFVMGEGAGMLVLEEYEHAKQRDARIYCEIKGYGLSGDAFHYTAPPKNGEGAQRAMMRALETANLIAEDIDYINCHATSTPLGDLAENRAIKAVFGDSKRYCVSSTKGATGHLLGAAGAVEALFTVLAIYHSIVPPTLNVDNLQEEFTLDYCPNEAKQRNIRHALNNSFGFGGTNASLLFSKL